MFIHRLLLTATVCVATSPLDETRLILREFLSSEDFLTDVRARIEPNDLIEYKLSKLSSNPFPAFQQLAGAPVGSWGNPLDENPSEMILEPFAGAKEYLKIPADSYANSAKEKLLKLWAQVSCVETSTAVADLSQTVRPIGGLFDQVNVGLYQLVQELNYMTSSEARNEDVLEYISLITQVHYRTALFFASPTAAQEWGPFSEALGFSLWTLANEASEAHPLVAAASSASPVNFPAVSVERAHACAIFLQGPAFRNPAEDQITGIEDGFGSAMKEGAALSGETRMGGEDDITTLPRKMHDAEMSSAMAGSDKQDMLEDVLFIGMHLADQAFGMATTTPDPTTTVAPTPDPVIAQKRSASLTAFKTAVTIDIDSLTDMIIAVEKIFGADENAFSLQVASLRSAVLSKHCSILAAAVSAGVLSKQQLMPISERLGSIPKRLSTARRVVEWPPVRDDVKEWLQLLRAGVMEIPV